MAIPVARVHLAMAHAALPGLLPTPLKCTIPTPPCVVILPSSPPKSKPSRADAAERWDAHKQIKPSGSPTSSSSSSSGSWGSMDGERWDSDKKKIAAARTSTSPSRTSSSSRADSEERWDAHKKPVVSLSSSASSSKKKGRCDSSKRHCCSSRASSTTAGRWDAHKTKPMALGTTHDLDDGESTSTGSNDDMEYYVASMPRPERAMYAGPGFTGSPDPSMLPMPTSLTMIRVA